jgi:hypothetical protein
VLVLVEPPDPDALLVEEVAVSSLKQPAPRARASDAGKKTRGVRASIPR